MNDYESDESIMNFQEIGVATLLNILNHPCESFLKFQQDSTGQVFRLSIY